MTASKAAIRRLEAITFRAWPARELNQGEGWEMRFTDGLHRRLNSVTIWPEAEGSLDDLVERAEVWFADRGRSAIHKLTEASAPGLDDNLAERGYTIDAPTLVQSRAINPGSGGSKHEITATATTEWMDTFCGISGMADDQRAILGGILDRVEGTAGYVLAREDGRPAATGLGVVIDGHLGLFEIVTDPMWRGRGLAQQVIGSLMGWGSSNGAVVCYLQVEESNTAALRLYKRLGFETQYRYWYRVAS